MCQITPEPGGRGWPCGTVHAPRLTTINADVIRVFYPIPFDWNFEATGSYTRRIPPPPHQRAMTRNKLDELLRHLRAHCTHSQKRSVIIRLDPAGQPKERNRVTLTFRCGDCGAVREFVGDHVKVSDEESTVSASIVGDTGWQVSRKRV